MSESPAKGTSWNPRSQIRVFHGYSMDCQGSKGYSSEKLILWSSCADAQIELNLRCEAIFVPGAIIWANLNMVYLVILHTKYKSSRPSNFSKIFFFCMFLICKCEVDVNPVTSRMKPFWPHFEQTWYSTNRWCNNLRHFVFWQEKK